MTNLDGPYVGAIVGGTSGMKVGETDGAIEGFTLGTLVGFKEVGCIDGCIVGEVTYK